MDESILDLYESVSSQVESLPPFDEMLFYTGSADAEIVVVSEAPTLPNGPTDHTLYHTVTIEKSDEPPAEIAEYTRSYPFDADHRNDLFREYVDRILQFCNDPADEIGFTDLCKRPLDSFTEDVDLDTVWNETPYSQQDVIMAQLRVIDPSIIVCNKKNVSRLLSQALIGTDAYTGDGWPEDTWHHVSGKDLVVVYSTMAHMQMSLLSRKRLSKEIESIYQENAGPYS